MRFHIAVIDDRPQLAHALADWSGLESVPGVRIEFFQGPFADREEVTSVLRHFECIVPMRERTTLDRDTLKQLPSLRLIASTGKSNPAIDLQAARQLNITVTGTRTPRAVVATVEHTWALIMATLRFIPSEDAAVRLGQWQTRLGGLLEGSRIGIVGLGTIGSSLVPLAHAFGAEPVAWSRSLDMATASTHGANYVSRSELFRTSDVVTVHIRSVPETRGYVTAGDIEMMQDSAHFVNTSRAAVVDYQALRRFLLEGAIAGAALDVFEEEPLAPDDVLRSARNVVLSPHVGFATRESFADYYKGAITAIRCFLTGEKPDLVLT